MSKWQRIPGLFEEHELTQLIRNEPTMDWTFGASDRGSGKIMYSVWNKEHHPCPGDLITESLCPCCGASLRVEYGDDEGEIGIIGKATEQDEDSYPPPPGYVCNACGREYPADGYRWLGGVCGHPDCNGHLARKR